MYINKLTRLVNVVWFSCQLFQFFDSARPDWSLNVLVPHTFLLQNFHLLKSTHIMVIVKKPEMDKKNQGNEKKNRRRSLTAGNKSSTFPFISYFRFLRCRSLQFVAKNFRSSKKKHFKLPAQSLAGVFMERRTFWIASWMTSSTSSSSWTVR